MRMGLLVLVVLVSISVLAAAPKPVSHVLAWDYGATATSFALEQCTNTRQGCPMQPALTLAGTLHTVEIGGLDRRVSYCWRMRAQFAGGQTPYSNVVCSP